MAAATATIAPAPTSIAHMAMPTAMAYAAKVIASPVAVAPREGKAFSISVADVADNLPRYYHGDWRHWVDDDGDCQDAQRETLIAAALGAIAYEWADERRAASGLASIPARALQTLAIWKLTIWFRCSTRIYRARGSGTRSASGNALTIWTTQSPDCGQDGC